MLMPNRVVRESVLDSDRYQALPHDSERLLFFELLLLCDDFGLVPLNYGFLRRKCTPCSHKTEAQVASMVQALGDVDLIRCYQSDGGSTFGFIPRFGNTPRAKKPKWPLPPKTPAFNEINRLAVIRNTSALETETETDKDSPGGESSGRLACPQQEIQRLYNELLPELPAARLWTSDRQTHAKARWREVTKAKGWLCVEDGLAWFRRFFEAVREDDFLMGRTGRGRGHESWECGIDFLLSPRGFRRVFEGVGQRIKAPA